MRGRWYLVVGLLWLAVGPAEAEAPILADLWTKVSTGRFIGAPAAGRDGLVWLLNEDKYLYAYDAQGQVKAQLTQGQRFLPWLLVTEKGDVGVAWRNHSFGLARTGATGYQWQWTFPLDANLSCPPATDRVGALYLGTEQGSLYALSSGGQLLWSAHLGQALEAVAVDVGGRLLACAGGVLHTYDLSGQLLSEQPALDGVQGLLIPSSGGVLLWNSREIRLLGQSPLPQWRLAVTQDRVLGCLLTAQEEVLVVFARSVQTIRQGQWGPAHPLPVSAVSAGGLSLDDQLVLPSSDGLLILNSAGQVMARRQDWGRPTGLVLTESGLVLTGGQDWLVRAALTKGVRQAGWSQTGGDAGRTMLSHREGSWDELVALWSTDPDFQLLNLLASKPDDTSQKQLLTEMEAKIKAGTLLRDWPFANLILARIALSGIEWVQLDRGRVLNNWPENRSRAYRLLVQTADPSLRQVFLSVLNREFDSEALGGIIESLGTVGYDFDGQISRSLEELQRRKPKDGRVAVAVTAAAWKLYQFNHRIPDKALLEALSRIYQGNFPREIRLQAQQTFQQLMGFKAP